MEDGGGMEPEYQAIRAVFNERSLVVYQAYSPAIAEPAVVAQRFVPPFSLSRMTWIKPSFLWMMERSGWASKSGQERVLAMHICREAFEDALRLAALSHPNPRVYAHKEAWREAVRRAPVRVQWDPERSLKGGKLPYRSLQVGLGPPVSGAYAREWIVRMEDVTELAHRIKAFKDARDWERAEALLPRETIYPVPEDIRTRLGMDGVGHGS